jgi:PAS domain S-box-containing protein
MLESFIGSAACKATRACTRHPQRTMIGMNQKPTDDDFLSEIFDQLTEGVATLSEDGAVASWNPGAATLTGYSLLEINAIGLAQIFENPADMERLLQATRSGIPTTGERMILKCADGQRVSVDVRCSPLRHIEQAQGRCIVVMRDLSELEALRNRLLQSERLSLLGRLAGSVSHEIRNPLSAIMLHVDILQDKLRQFDIDSHDQIDRSLQVIKDEITRLHELIQQYLSLAHLSELPREPVDLRDYLETFEAEMRPYLAARGITWRLEGDSDLSQVSLHPNSFRRVLLNLLNNAVDAMPHGGVLTLRTRRLADRVQIDLHDTGCGIHPAQIPQLFTPLHTTKPEGTGLGLYLAREIVLAHQGDITVASQPAGGTTFTISLPLLAGNCSPAVAKGERTL